MEQYFFGKCNPFYTTLNPFAADAHKPIMCHNQQMKVTESLLLQNHRWLQLAHVIYF